MNLLLAVLLAAAAPEAGDVVVVCPPAFQAALRPWSEHRAAQGHRVEVISNAGTAEEITAQIRARPRRPQYVLLVGDAEPRMADDAGLRARCVPTHYVKAKVNVRWGSEPEIATDAPYGDLDGDGRPDAAVGRLPADSPEELDRMIAKTLAYERSSDHGLWRRQVNCVAGIGGFGMLADAVLESSARYLLTHNVPAAYRVSMTYGSWRSPYCPDPRQFRAATLDRLNEGAWFWVYIGHGQPYSLDRARMPDGDYPIFTLADAAQLRSRHAGPIALFLACYTGAFDAPHDCLGEEMLRQPGGPVAVLAGSRVTMPYAMAVFSVGLMDEVFQRRAATLGLAALRAKQRLRQATAKGDAQRAALDALAAALSPAPDQLAEERAEHVLLFNLLGDPLLRLRHPQPLPLEVPTAGAAAARLKITGVAPFAGVATVELIVPRGRLTFTPPPRPAYPNDADGRAALQEVYQKANDPRWAVAVQRVGAGPFTAELDVPAAAVGNCQVCAFLEGAGDFALGAAEVKIEPVRPAE